MRCCARRNPRAAHDAQADDEGIAEIAVEGLMNAPPERALPLLKKVLQSQHSNEVKKRALFVLSQIDEDAALDAVVDVAKTSNDKELREDAIRMLGVSGEDRAIKRLREMYTANADATEKRAIVQAWLTADRKDLVLEAARNEADPNVRREAIEALGAMEASEELEQLFEARTTCRTSARSSSRSAWRARCRRSARSRRASNPMRSASKRFTRSASPATRAARRRW